MDNRMDDKLTKHHRVPESRGGTRAPDNMLSIRDRKHQAFHVVFSNQTYVEQILSLTDMNGPALSADITHAIGRALREFRWANEIYAYKNGVLVPERFLEAQGKYSHFRKK